MNRYPLLLIPQRSTLGLIVRDNGIIAHVRALTLERGTYSICLCGIYAKGLTADIRIGSPGQAFVRASYTNGIVSYYLTTKAGGTIMVSEPDLTLFNSAVQVELQYAASRIRPILTIPGQLMDEEPGTIRYCTC